MLKSIILCVVLFTTVLTMEIAEFDTNNLIEFNTVPIHEISLPYYRHRQNHIKKMYEVKEPPVIEDIVLPTLETTQEVAVYKVGLISTVVSNIFNIAKSAVQLVLSSAPGLMFGSILAFGICKLTPLCSTLSYMKSMFDLQDIASVVVGDKIDIASQLLEQALKKFT